MAEIESRASGFIPPSVGRCRGRLAFAFVGRVASSLDILSHHPFSEYISHRSDPAILKCGSQHLLLSSKDANGVPRVHHLIHAHNRFEDVERACGGR
eukprot:scaffold1661_cov251-Pinguiococcus_pyrenoidosus.AAC.46